MEDQNIQQQMISVPKEVADQIKPIPIVDNVQYPTVEDMTFRGIINSREEGLALLRAVQIMVNELGAPTIVQLMKILENKPQLMQQAKSYLPYLLKM